MPPSATECFGRMGSKCISAISCVALLCLAACDPPGKPKPETTAAATDFKVLFAENCAGCHGDLGKNGPARILNNALYLAVVPKETLKQIVIRGRPGTAMPAWAKSEGGPLTPAQIDALVDGIYQSWAKPVHFGAAQPAPAYAAGDQKGDAEAGRKVFLRSCFMCHGPGAKVGSVSDPSYLSLVSDQMLRTSIIVGRPDLGMPDYRVLKLGKPLADQDVTDVVAFLSSKRPVGAGSWSAGSSAQAGQQSGTTGTHVNESGTEQGAGNPARGNEGSGNGPGSRRQEHGEGNKSTGANSRQGIK